MRNARGFTLIELLVAVSIMAVMAVMGWRALDGMQQTSTQTRAHTDAVLTLEAGLAQWGADLDGLVELPQCTALDWDGRALRMTRRHAADPKLGVLVVAWSRAQRQDGAQWLRWQSAPVRTRREWLDAWQAAGRWAQNPSLTPQAGEVALAPAAQWQIYYFRGNAWSNPHSSADPTAAKPEVAVGPAIPDGIRLVLDIAPPHPLYGTLTRDWARPTLTVDSR